MVISISIFWVKANVLSTVCMIHALLPARHALSHLRLHHFPPRSFQLHSSACYSLGTGDTY